jgi:hypothetical protein
MENIESLFPVSVPLTCWRYFSKFENDRIIGMLTRMALLMARTVDGITTLRLANAMEWYLITAKLEVTICGLKFSNSFFANTDRTLKKDAIRGLDDVVIKGLCLRK